MSSHALMIDDTPAARREFNEQQAQFGVYANAEDLILGWRLEQDPAVKQVSLLQLDAEATAKVNLGTAQKDFDLPGPAVSVAVRAEPGKPRAAVFVYEDSRGGLKKVVRPYDADWKRPPLSKAEASMRAKLEQRRRTREEADGLVEEAEASIAAAAANIARTTEAAVASMMAESEQRLERFAAELAEREQATMEAMTSRVEAAEAVSEPEDGEETTGETGPAPEAAAEPEPAVSFPRSHADLDKIAESHGVEFPEGAKVPEKIAALKAAGVEPG